MQVLRADEADDAVDQERVERPGHAVGPGLQRELIDAVVRPGRQGAALARSRSTSPGRRPRPRRGCGGARRTRSRPSRSSARLMPKLALAASVPATDWNSRSTGAPRSSAASWVRDVGQAARLRRDRVARRSAGRGRGGSRRSISTDSAAGLTPITASPQPKSRPSTAESRMPPRSSAGWFGWTRTPSTPRSPIVLRQRVTTRTLLAARTRSLLLISLATAAATSGVIARCSRRELGLAASRRRAGTRGTRRRSGRAIGAKAVAVERVEDQPADLVVVGVDQRVVDDLAERHVGQDQLGRDPLALRPRGDARRAGRPTSPRSPWRRPRAGRRR